jgi:hypothetical protein
MTLHDIIKDKWQAHEREWERKMQREIWVQLMLYYIMGLITGGFGVAAMFKS